jgi:UDP-GlcNAc:undecaprenyl-phosphate GlcNAc-1-phosphate transferase
VVDDRVGLPALPKLVVQLAAAAVAIAFGFQVDHLTDPISRTTIYFAPWFSWLLTTGWIVVVTNAINLIDGLDGLCSGVSAIVAATLTIIAWEAGHVPGVILGLVLVGALLGFLPYNFPPARIFIGDTGALFIGYTLSILVLEGYQRVDVISFVVPLLALAVPLLDTGLSIIRRIRSHAGIMQADRHHIHHRLLSEYRGDHRPAVLSIYFLTACFCVIAVSFTRLRGPIAIVFMIVIVLLTVRILRNLRFLEVAEPSPTRSGGEDRPEAPEHARPPATSHASEDSP